MSEVANKRFKPPTGEQVEALLDEHPLRAPSPLAAWAPLLVFGALLAVVLVAEGIWAALLPWAGLAAMFAYMVFRLHRARQLDQRVTRAQELAMLRRHRDALALGWRLLPALQKTPSPYLRTMSLMGHCLQEIYAYEPAIVCFDRLLKMLPKDHPGSIHLALHRAIAALETERLLDADDALRRMRSLITQQPDTATAALYRLTELIQHVRTGHYDEALAHADTLLDNLRPLGVEAGYGHALIAFCYHHARGDADTLAQHQRQALIWWQRATTLLPAEALTERFPELVVMEQST